MMRTTVLAVLAFLSVALAAPAWSQTSVPGPGIDVEIYNADDGDNAFTGEIDDTFWAYVFVRPGNDTLSCELACRSASGIAQGGPANIATGIIDITFDTTSLEFIRAENNPATAAVDGLLQEQFLEQGRIGWALAGDWTPDADAENGTLEDPCLMAKLSTADWVFRIEFRIIEEQPSTLHIRRENDIQSFPLSFADVCGSPAFKEGNGGIDEVIDAEVNPPDDSKSEARTTR